MSTPVIKDIHVHVNINSMRYTWYKIYIMHRSLGWRNLICPIDSILFSSESYMYKLDCLFCRDSKHTEIDTCKEIVRLKEREKESDKERDWEREREREREKENERNIGRDK